MIIFFLLCGFALVLISCVFYLYFCGYACFCYRACLDIVFVFYLSSFTLLVWLSNLIHLVFLVEVDAF